MFRACTPFPAIRLRTFWPHRTVRMPPRHGGFTLAILALSVLALTIAQCGQALTKGGATPCATWRVIPNPKPTPESHISWNAVSVLSPTSAWVVGDIWEEGAIGMPRSLIEQWDGSSWHIVPGPEGFYRLDGMAAISPTDVWAVGSRPNPTNLQTVALTLHWNGTAWTGVASPNPGAYASGLNDVAALATNDVWAVGWYAEDSDSTTVTSLTEHWDGNTWMVVANPVARAGSREVLNATSHIPGTTQLWAVGSTATANGPQQGLIERWDGHAWNRILTATPSGAWSHLNDVVALSATDAWAVGTYRSPSSQEEDQVGMINHWNGATWQMAALPKITTVPVSEFLGVAAGPQDVRAVGADFITPNGGPAPIARWDGAIWNLIRSPTSGSTRSSVLNAIAIDGAGQYWAVGRNDAFARGGDQPLTLHCP